LQLRGDSLRRQLEASTAYAAVNELDLVADDRLQDIGVSAFKGANVAGGALGRFLEAANAGKVPRGSFLLVESLDRLSRQEIHKSLTLFLSILNAGVNIVTLADNRVYTADNPQFQDLLISLVVMSRAHDESHTKSLRIGAAWANKRAHAKTQPLTAMCPAWLPAQYQDEEGPLFGPFFFAWLRPLDPLTNPSDPEPCRPPAYTSNVRWNASAASARPVSCWSGRA